MAAYSRLTPDAWQPLSLRQAAPLLHTCLHDLRNGGEAPGCGNNFTFAPGASGMDCSCTAEAELFGRLNLTDAAEPCRCRAQLFFLIGSPLMRR